MSFNGAILGLDLARLWGWAVIDADGFYIASGNGELDADSIGARVHMLREVIYKIVAQYPVAWIVAEDPITHSYKVARHLFSYLYAADEVASCLRVGFFAMKRRDAVTRLFPTSRISKEEGLAWVQTINPSVISYDEADAMIVARAFHQVRAESFTDSN